MAYIHDFSTSATIIKDLAEKLVIGDTLVPENNWELVFPEPGVEVTNIATLKSKPKRTKEWLKKLPRTVDVAGNINLEQIEISRVTVTTAPSSAGDVRVTLNGVDFDVTLLGTETVEDVINTVGDYIAANSTYTVVKSGDFMTIDASAPQEELDVRFTDVGGTGVTTFNQVVQQGFSGAMADGGLVRVFVLDKKYNLYYTETTDPLDILEFRKVDGTTLETHVDMAGKVVLVDFEKVVDVESEYYVRLEKPATVDIGGETVDNDYFFQWEYGEGYDPTEELTYSTPGSGQYFPADHSNAVPVKCSFFRETEDAKLIAKSWLPIEYWLSFDQDACAGVIMGDPGLSVEQWLSSPIYFGSLNGIEGALETDIKGNFAAFSGSFSQPKLIDSYSINVATGLPESVMNEDYKVYGDYTGTGMSDVIVASTKTGRPYQAHKVAVFGGYEFREKTFNGQSSHTGKHAVSDIVVADLHENDRGILKHCLAVPRVAKEHQTELIYNRYESGKEETYIFLNINAPYTPFNTGSDSLIGFAIRIDI